MKKRSNGEGSFRKLPSGNWSGQIMVGYTPEGKRKVKTFTAPTKSEVQQKIRQYIDGLNEEEKAKSRVTFSQWADKWYASHRSEVEESTYCNYGFTLKRLKDYFGDRPINGIKQMDINDFIDTLLDKNLSKSTISKCKAMLFQIFTYAEDNDMIDKNPSIRAKSAKKAPKHVYPKHAFTPDEIRALLEQLPDDLTGNSIRTLIGTGIRVQELLALTKDDISPDGSLIVVNKAVKMAYREPYLGSTKSDIGERVIPVSAKYQEYARYLREHGGSKYIWTSTIRESGLYTIEEFRSKYKAAMKKVPDVPYCSPHCCRHTYITELQAQQVPLEFISALAGHEDTETTKGYTHISIDTLKGIINALDKKGASV